MKQFSPVRKKLFENISRQFPEFGEFLAEWRQEELENLPYAADTNMDVLRGRVQTLTELRQGLFGRD